MPIPPLTEAGELPLGIHRATLQETLTRFGTESSRRKVLAIRLERIYQLAFETGHLARFVVFGSFVTAKPEPNDVDVFMILEDTFDMNQLAGFSRLLFTHTDAQAHFGGSVFWVRRLAALGGEQATLEHWQVKRDGSRRGIVEIIAEGS